MTQSMTWWWGNKQLAVILSAGCYLRHNYLPKGKEWTLKESCQCSKWAGLISFLSRIFHLVGSSVMGAKFSTMSLFRPRSQAWNSFLLNHKAHVHFIAPGVSLCYINTYLQSEGKAYVHSLKKTPYIVIIHTYPCIILPTIHYFFSINY